MNRRQALTTLVGAAAAGPLAAAGFLPSARAAGGTAPPRRLLLGDGHLLLALSLIHPDPAALLCAWHGDLRLYSTRIFEDYAAATPALADVPVVGQANPSSFSVEAALAARPDVALLQGCYGPGPEDSHVTRRLEAAGVRVVFVDFYEDPLANTAPGMRALGRLFGGEAERRAKAFAAFHTERLDRIARRIAVAAPKRPKVFLQANAAAPGWDCCYLPGTGGLGRFIELCGGDNIGALTGADRPWVKVNREFALASQPDVFVTTGGPFLAGKTGLVAGPGIRRAEARRTLAAAVEAPPARHFKAVAEQRVFGLWHLLHATPFNVVAAEALAKWLHPDLFADIDPDATLAAINRDFLAVPLTGTLTVSLKQDTRTGSDG